MEKKTITILCDADEETITVAKHTKIVNQLCIVIVALTLAAVLLMFRTGC